MKSYKRIMPIFLIVALLGTAAYSLSQKRDVSASYQTALAEARNMAEKGIRTDAIAGYERALDISPTLDVCLEAGEIYLQDGDLEGARDWYQDQLLRRFPRQEQTYLYGLRLCLAANNYRNAFSVYEEYRSRGLHLQEIEDMMEGILYMYDLSGSYEDAGPFSGNTGTAAVMYGGLWGYVDGNGRRVIDYDYTAAAVFGTYAAVTAEDGRSYYIDGAGNEKINENFILEKDPDFGHVTRFRPIQSGLILAFNGSVWNYYDAGTYEKRFGGYREATPITMGVGAVSGDGVHWALISDEGELLTEPVYDSVLADGKDVVCRSGAVVVQQNGQYMLVDAKGKQLSADTYEKACAFYDGTYAACGSGEQWSFLDDKGQTVLTGEYEDARSFSNGLAAVKQGGLWGYIDTAGTLVIPCAFDEAGPFSGTGTAFVRSGDSWKLLSLYRYNYD